MSTAQQLGLIGNSIKVQSLPTASAETFGAGNRFYTLIGQQEGYITGHTYHTVVANDVYSWEDVAGIFVEKEYVIDTTDPDWYTKLTALLPTMKLPYVVWNNKYNPNSYRKTPFDTAFMTSMSIWSANNAVGQVPDTSPRLDILKIASTGITVAMCYLSPKGTISYADTQECTSCKFLYY